MTDPNTNYHTKVKHEQQVKEFVHPQQ